jgi:hypothetical protein
MRRCVMKTCQRLVLPRFTCQVSTILGPDQFGNADGFLCLRCAGKVQEWNERRVRAIHSDNDVEYARLAICFRAWRSGRVDNPTESLAIDDERPYSPSHGPGNDPYFVREIGTELDQKTSFRGQVNE